MSSPQDWSLHRKGPRDQARHRRKIREALRQSLPRLISEESIITSDGDRVVKVPIRSLKEYRFRFDPRGNEHVGQGGEDLEPGDVIARESPEEQDGDGREGGRQPGRDYIEAEVSVDEIAELIFEDLELPHLENKGERRLEEPETRFTSVSRTGSMSNLDKRRTILANIKRNARRGDAAFGDLQDDDLRYRTWREHHRERSSAAVIAMRDVSASMGTFKKYMCRSFYFWMVRFLRTKYDEVEIAFITHHTQAQEVDEDTFFKLGESGGTRVSSAYQLAAEMIEQRYPPSRWNLYPFHFSDGDNWGASDNRRCRELVRDLLRICNVFGYGEINDGGYTSPLMSTFAEIEDRAFIAVTITRREDVYPALRKFFSPRSEAASS